MIKMESMQQQAVKNFFVSFRERCDHNNRCFDCNAENPQWASVSFGIVLCLNCSSVHRNMGASLSLIRSINLDIWNDRQIAHMDKGGNDSLFSFFEEYGLNAEDAKSRYGSKAASYYKKYLTALATNDQAQVRNLDRPDSQEGRLNSDLPSPGFQREGETIDPQTEPPQYIYNSNPIEEEKVPQIPPADLPAEQRYEWNPKLKEGTQKVFRKADETLDKIKNSVIVTKVATKIEENKVAQKIGHAGKTAFNFIVTKGKQIGGKVDEKIEKTPKLSKAIGNTKEDLNKATKIVGKGLSKLMCKIGLMKPAQAPQPYAASHFEEIEASSAQQQIQGESLERVVPPMDYYAINRGSLSEEQVEAPATPANDSTPYQY